MLVTFSTLVFQVLSSSSKVYTYLFPKKYKDWSYQAVKQLQMHLEQKIATEKYYSI